MDGGFMKIRKHDKRRGIVEIEVTDGQNGKKGEE